jgi:integral membrane sensor domain MASE1
MDDNKHQKWYFKTWSLVASFLCVGPFMLPLVWANPRFNKKSKVIITLLVLLVTYVMTAYLVKSVQNILNYYKLAFIGA